MTILKKLVDAVWNLKILTGYRTKIAQGCLLLLVAAAGYQTAATNTQLITSGIDLPDLPAAVVGTLAGLSAYFVGKIKRFVKEHQDA